MFTTARRLFAITRIFRHYGVFIILARYSKKPAVAWLNFASPKRYYAQLTEAARIHRALQDLGPLFIKLGQSLSTRPDLIPPEIAEELSSLQDAVPPFDSALARATIESELGKPLQDLFAHFEEQPLGSASIAQVHGAVLHNGTRVVVKVLRPGIEHEIARDVSVLHTLARILHRHSPLATQFKLKDVVQELDKTLHDELDLMREAANSSVLRRHFMADRNLLIPAVYWEFTSQRVATFERIHGTPIDDIQALDAQGVDRVRLAKQCLEVFFTQVFRDAYFHADMHPGNMFVSANDVEPHPTLILVDFGIMGTLTPTDQRYLAQNLMAFIHRDYRKVARLHIESGWVPADTRLDDFESAIRTVCEPMFERPIQDISFGKLLLRLFETAQRFHMHIQPQLILLQKTILNIEGVGRHLDPHLNVWDTASPIINTWIRSQYGLKNFMKKLGEVLPEIPEILELIHQKIKNPGYTVVPRDSI